ncbi:MAG: hypothetical protein C4519_19050 [Desulfobacteraceae bacterium]|nr:MAG: hypothetical protein C4519_19050 [Desulfobacteraceae bacterium]
MMAAGMPKRACGAGDASEKGCNAIDFEMPLGRAAVIGSGLHKRIQCGPGDREPALAEAWEC